MTEQTKQKVDMDSFITLLKRHDACTEGIEWVESHASVKDVWYNCQRADWMLFLLQNVLGIKDDKRYRLFACWCVRNTPLSDGRKVWDLLTDNLSRSAVEVDERFANSEATTDELFKARDAAWAAAVDAVQCVNLREVFTWEEVESAIAKAGGEG